MVKVIGFSPDSSPADSYIDRSVPGLTGGHGSVLQRNAQFLDDRGESREVGLVLHVELLARADPRIFLDFESAADS
jgi:hypothetical protein